MCGDPLPQPQSRNTFLYRIGNHARAGPVALTYIVSPPLFFMSPPVVGVQQRLGVRSVGSKTSQKTKNSNPIPKFLRPRKNFGITPSDLSEPERLQKRRQKFGRNFRQTPPPKSVSGSGNTSLTPKKPMPKMAIGNLVHTK